MTNPRNNQQLKLLFVATEPAPGMVPFAAAIINAFAQAGHKVWAITYSSRQCSYREVISDKVMLYDTPFPALPADKAKFKLFPQQLYEKIVKVATDNEISNIHLLTGEYGLAPFYTSRLNRKFNLVYTVHDLEAHPDTFKEMFITKPKTCLWKLYFHNMTLRNIHLTNNLATSSKSQYRELRKRYPNKNILWHSFPLLITSKIKEGNKVCPELKDEKDYILFFGTFVGYKGVDLLYYAFLNSKLCDKYKLVLAGKGAYFFKVSKEERNIIRINRFILDDEVSMLYRNAKLVVYPYRQATQSGVISMAHYFRKRIIASDIPYFRDNISPNDALFKSEDINDLIHVLENEVENVSFQTHSEMMFPDIVNELSSIYKF